MTKIAGRTRVAAVRVLLPLVAVLLVVAAVAAAAFYWNPLWFMDRQIRLHLYRAHVQSEYVTVDGQRLHFYEAAPRRAPGTPLLLIHGLGARGEDWSPMLPALAAAGFHVYVPDLLGYGRSAKPDVPYTIPLEERTIVSFMKAVGLDHADLDGWSMGGWIASAIALDHPAMVDRLILDDAAGIRFDPAFARTAFVPTDDAGLHRLIDLLTPTHPVLPDFVRRATLRRIALSGRVVQSNLDSMESGADLLDQRLPAISQPTLILWGERDSLIPSAVGRRMHSLIPHSTYIEIPGCGHLAPSQCAEPVLRATIAFLNTPLPTSAHTIAAPADAPQATQTSAAPRLSRPTRTPRPAPAPRTPARAARTPAP